MDRLALRAEKFAELVPGVPDTNVADVSDSLRNFVFGNLFHEGGLSDRTREMITITNTATMQIFGELKIHVAIGMRAGLTPEEVYECVSQLAPFIGFPKTLAAQGVCREGFAAANVETPVKSLKTVAEAERSAKGAELEGKLFADADLQYVPDRIKGYITDMCIGEFLTRGGLDFNTRILLCLCSAVAIAAPEDVIDLFVKANLNAGNDRQMMEDAMAHSTGYIGFPLVLRALARIAKICK